MTIRLFGVLTFVLSSLAAEAAVQVVDRGGKPLANVRVLIGASANLPFPGNQLVTDSNGNFVPPAGWTGPQPVTLEAADFVRTTHMNIVPSVTRLTMSPSDGDQQIQLSGELTDYGPIRTDGKVDVGIFIPAVPASELLYFDVGWMVSPEFDILRVLGREMAIPSNLALPKQSESYIFPINLDKPEFRMFVRKPGKYRFLAVHGQFPIKKTVDDIRAGVPVTDLVNHVTLLKSGVVDLDVTGAKTGLSIPVAGLGFDSTVTVQAPTMAADDVILSVALSTLDESGALVPSDVKRLKSNQVQVLKAPSTKSAPMALSAWMKQKPNTRFKTQAHRPLAEDLLNIPFDLFYSVFDQQTMASVTVDYNQVSFATHAQSGQAPQFLGLVEPPVISGSQVRMTPPTAPAGVLPAGTMLLYSAIKTNTHGKITTESRTRLWEVWLPGWATEATLPSLATLPKGSANKFRWEVLYLGKAGQGIIKSVGQDFTHVSRNSRDF